MALARKGRSEKKIGPKEGFVLSESGRLAAQHRTSMLLDLANLDDSLCARFYLRYARWYSLPNEFEKLLKYRSQLRQVWSGTVNPMLALGTWVQEAQRVRNRSLFRLAMSDGRWGVVPDSTLLPLSLALGVSKLLPKVGVCANPDCPAPYFLKGRKTQRFCDRPTCAAYGQREHKKNWWKEHGKEWKEKWEAKRKRRRKNHAQAKKA